MRTILAVLFLFTLSAMAFGGEKYTKEFFSAKLEEAIKVKDPGLLDRARLDVGYAEMGKHLFMLGVTYAANDIGEANGQKDTKAVVDEIVAITSGLKISPAMLSVTCLTIVDQKNPKVQVVIGGAEFTEKDGVRLLSADEVTKLFKK